MPLDFPSWLLGFIDGEGCFCISFSKRSNCKLGLEVRPSFSVSQKSHSVAALKRVQDFFKCGGIRPCKSDGTDKYEVRRLSDLHNTIIPFFTQNHLLTNKQNDFVLFSAVCSIIKQNRHLSREGLREIIGLATQMNMSGKKKYSRQELLDILDKNS